MSKKSLEYAILIDGKVSKTSKFIQALEETTGVKWTIVTGVSSSYNQRNIIQNTLRYLEYFYIPFKVFLTRKRYRQILAWQQFYGLILAWYFRMFKVKTAPEITVMTFIYKPKGSSFIGKMYEKFIKYIVASDYITHFVVYSQAEREYYSNLFGVDKDKFVPQKIGIDDVREKYVEKNNEQPYWFSAGRSNRDYSFLFDAWDLIDEECKSHLKIVCDNLHRKNTDTITVLNKCFGAEYLQEMSNCYAVIVPLQDTKISSGQLVILQAMMFGKPVIVTRNEAVSDYVTDSVTGIIIEKEAAALLEAMIKLSNEDFYQFLSKNARKSFEDNFSSYRLGVGIGTLLGCQEKNEVSIK